MPYRRRTVKRRFRRRTYRKPKFSYMNRYAGSRRPVPGTRNVLSVFPDFKIVHLPFVDRFTLNPGMSATPVAQAVRVNSIYQPIPSNSHQCALLDTLDDVYKYYTVVSSTIQAWFMPITSNSEPLVCGITLDPNFDGFTANYIDNMEQSGCKFKIASFSDGNQIIKLTSNYDAKRDMSVKNPLDEPNLGALFTADPSKIGLWHVWAGPADISSDVNAIQVIVRCVYKVVLSRSVYPGQS